MSRFWRQIAVVVFAGATVIGCQTPQPPAPKPVSTPKPSAIYKVGDPYQIGGTWYYPHEQPDYDETGVASWYGPGFYGKTTANGEIYDAGDLTAAHRTLPMPVNVRVTNLENGKSMVLRVNDRGPFAKGRIIDVSEHAAQMLGFHQQGVTKVRVTYIGVADINGVPADTTPANVASAARAAPQSVVQEGGLDALPGVKVSSSRKTVEKPVAQAAPPPPMTHALGQVSNEPVPSVTHLYVQVGAFANHENARRLMLKLGVGAKIYPVQQGNTTLYRLRLGPFDLDTDAEAALNQVMARGSQDAKIVVDQ